jgi:hypothetical protein
MKSEINQFFSLVPATVALFAFAISVPETHAQVNERKVLRDASGVYRGATRGGQFSVTYDDGAPGFTFGAAQSSGKARVPVKKGRTKSAVRHPDIPSDEGFDDNGRAAGQARQRPKVTRNGTRVSTRVSAGKIKVDDDPRKGDWQKAKGSARLDKRGKAWKATASSISTQQRNTRFLGSPPDHTKRLSSLGLRGRG